MHFPLTLPAPCPTPRHAAFRAARPLLSWICQLREYEQLYRRAQSIEGAPFYTRALRALEIDVEVRAADRPVPAQGPLIVAANHPHGIVDGLALAEAIGRTRRDVRVLTNHLLQWLPGLDEMCLFVDAFGRSAAASRAGLRDARRWLDRGGALIVFPSGAVAHQQWRTWATPIDGPWQDTVGRLALNSGAPILPAHIAGRNRDVFYRAGEWHSVLRTLMLPRELLARRAQRVQVSLGRPLAFDRHGTGRKRGKVVTAIARAEVERLGDGAASGPPPAFAAAPDLASMRAEIAALDDCRIVAGETVDVYCAPAQRIPVLLREIGRRREIAFRAVGEGTGHALDLDRFDRHYLHLFAWDRHAERVAGAYRLGVVDTIVAEHGISGLYTSTLFRFEPRVFSRLGPAIELGRSFVRAEYQRSSSVLMLLWKAIAQVVVRTDGCRVLFGPVSISARYRDTSREMLQTFLAQNARHQELADMVSALTPPPSAPSALESPAGVQELDALIAGQEPDGKGVPVLLRQYLRLNAKLLAFNIDHAFGDALDALMMVDLGDVDRAILTRYFGRDGAARVLDRGALGHAA